jgi:outer membrane biosynthesis protein TonB
MKTGLTISGTGHVAFLLWSVLTLVGRPYHIDSTESLPVDVISATEFSQLTSGAKNAPQMPQSKPLVDKIGDPTPPVDDPTAKIAKKEVKAANDVPPVPEPKPPEPKAKKPPTPQAADPIADALKKDEDKKPDPKKADAKPPPTPPKKPAQPAAPAFDPRNVAALLDKRDPQRLAATGDTLNNTISMGVATGTAAVISQSEMDALKAKLAQFWNPPAGAKDPRELILDVEIKLKPDGTLDGPPRVLTSGHTPLFAAAQFSAAQAVNRAAPFTMLKPEHYDQWKDIVITFDPRTMLGG